MSCSDVVWTRSFELFEQWLRSWSPSGKRVAVVYGPTGVGKTTMIRCVSSKLGLDVVTFDYESGAKATDILRRARSLSWGGRIVVHIDRPFEEMGLKGRELARIARETVNPLVIEAEEPKLYRWLGAAEIRVEPPPKTAIASILKRKAIVKPNFRLVGSDVRQALMLAYGSDTYASRTWLDVLLECLKTGSCSELEDSHLPALLDSYVDNCYGWECIDAIMLLVAADYTRRPGLVLDGFKLSRPINRPTMYFFERWRAARESEETRR